MMYNQLFNYICTRDNYILDMKQSKYPFQQIYHNIAPFLQHRSKLTKVQVDKSDYYQALQDFDILVVGAGGLGCQLVKNLALNGFKRIHLIDMDTIDLTNLNRQFLFRMHDIGKYKADIVAKFIMNRCPGIEVITYKEKVQQYNQNFYSKFPIIIGGLDNVQARKYLNSIVFQLNKKLQVAQHIFIDGATQKLGGQVIVVEPYLTACYNCSRKGLSYKMKPQYCTLAVNPRTPEHCVQYVIQIQWAQIHQKQLMDTDNLNHMKWLYEKSLERAQKFNIQGVTEMLTLGVAKNIIPAIASTNAFIAAACVNEALKLASGIYPRMNNFFFYSGTPTIGSSTMLLKKQNDCQVCKMRQNIVEDISIELQFSDPLQNVIIQVQKVHNQLKKPFVNANEKILLNPADQQRFELKLKMSLKQLQQNGNLTSNPQNLYFTDKSLKSQLKVILTMKE